MRPITTFITLIALFSCTSDHAKLITELAGEYEGNMICTTEPYGNLVSERAEIITVKKDTFYGNMLVIFDYTLPVTEENLSFETDGGCFSIKNIKGEFIIDHDKVVLQFEETDETGTTPITCTFSGTKADK